MGRRIALSLCAAAVGMALFAGCGRSIKTPNYAQEAYIEQQIQKRQGPLPVSIDQSGADHLLAEVPEQEIPDAWTQQSYETAHEWLLRIREQIALNQDAIALLAQKRHALDADIKTSAEEIKTLAAQSGEIRTLLIEKQYTPTVQKKKPDPMGVPFVVHLVRKGDTLRSISEEYYKDPDLFEKIVQWNQGWIRSKDEIMAGVGLVLFQGDAKRTEPAVIDEHLELVRRVQVKQ